MEQQPVVAICSQCWHPNVLSGHAAGRIAVSRCQKCGFRLVVTGAPVEAILDSRLSRREFSIRSFISTLVLGVVAGAAGGILTQQWQRWSDDLAAQAEAERLFDEVFGIGPLRSLSLGRRYFGGTYHPDNVLAGLSLIDLLKLREELQGLRETRVYRDIDIPQHGDLVLVGGSSSTPLSRLVFGYEERPRYKASSYTSEDIGVDRLQRMQQPLVPMRFVGQSDEDELGPNRRLTGWQSVDYMPIAQAAAHLNLSEPQIRWKIDNGELEELEFATNLNGSEITHTEKRVAVKRLMVSYPWSFVNQETGMPHGPRLRKSRETPEGKEYFLPESNPLLITRVPNFMSPTFDPGNQTDWSHITVFGGGNGIGTRALELLATSVGLHAMKEIKNALGTDQYFQVLLDAGDVEDVDGVTKAHSIEVIEVVKGSDLVPFERMEEVYRNAFDYAMKKQAVSS